MPCSGGIAVSPVPLKAPFVDAIRLEGTLAGIGVDVGLEVCVEVDADPVEEVELLLIS